MTGADRYLCVGRGRKKVGRTITGNAGSCRHEARGAGIIDRGRPVAGAGDVQVGGDSYQDRRLGAGEKRDGFNNEWLCMGRR